jgi:hypothetical protein
MWLENDHNICRHDIQHNYFEKYKLSKMTISLGTMQKDTQNDNQ